MPRAKTRPAELLVTLEAFHVRAATLLFDDSFAIRAPSHVMPLLPVAKMLLYMTTNRHFVKVITAAHARLLFACLAFDPTCRRIERLIQDGATTCTRTEADANLLVLEKRFVLAEHFRRHQGLNNLLGQGIFAPRRRTHHLLLRDFAFQHLILNIPARTADTE